MGRCPGQDGRKLTVGEASCPGCGRTVEMFSDELRLRCPTCRTMIFREQMPSCIQWCQAAKDCVGPQMYQKLMGTAPAGGDDAAPAERFPPAQALGEEHQLILRALELAEEQVAALKSGAGPDAAASAKLLDFLRQFVESFHFAREETLLFERMKARGLPVAGGPLGTMLADHRQFRKRLARAEAAVERASGAARELAAQLGAGAGELRLHLRREEEILYPLAHKVLTDADQEKLADDMMQAEKDMGDDFLERCRGLLLDLARAEKQEP